VEKSAKIMQILSWRCH